MENATQVTEFVFKAFASFSGLPYFNSSLFCVFLFLYSLLFSGNILIILTISSSHHLHTPMYFFLSKLSFIDLCYSSVTVPKLLLDSLSERKVISFNSCIVQLFSFHFFGCAECFIFTVMAYDRFVAICKPLQYSRIMNRQCCLLLIAATWAVCIIHSTIQKGLTTELPFCGPNEIHSYFCDTPPLIKLACTDITVINIITVANSGIVSFCCFLTVVVSYVGIVSSVLKIKTIEGRRKAFSTCVSHLTAVLLFFGPCVFIYMRPSTELQADQVVRVFYTFIAPTLNPVIYTLRNEEIKTSVKNLLSRKPHSC
ncbi:olfactory receptor 4E2-like [Pelobates fuscus]|uniref:olfactory receptor 4E2-like n=1 Tax=Pelobates fuscus TaxID=191477 RepID=UPI002FE4376F